MYTNFHHDRSQFYKFGPPKYKMEEKKRRKREKPQKKWTEEEINILLEFLLENVDIEKPSAQTYYSKCISKTGLNATVEMIRCKVRYLKTTFSKAEEWRKSTGAGVDVEDECSTIKEKLKKMCPHYDRLAGLFSNKENGNVVMESSILFEELIADDSEGLVEVLLEEEEPEVVVLSSLAAPSSQSPSVKSTAPEAITPNAFGQKLKTRKPKNSINALSEIQKKRDALMEQRLCIEEEKLKIEKVRLEIDKEKMCKDFELRKLELEQKERLAMIELKYKYKNKE